MPDHPRPGGPPTRPATPAGRVVIPARRPASLVFPFAIASELAGAALILAGNTTIGIIWCIAPVAALLVTTLLVRPSLELTREGIVQKQYPFSSLTRWEAVDHLGLTRAGNRVVLAYKLVEGIPAPRRQPAAALLRAAGRPFDGGFFADSLRGDPETILALVDGYLRDPARRDALRSGA